MTVASKVERDQPERRRADPRPSRRYGCQRQRASRSLACQALVVVGGRRELDFLELGRVVGLDPAGEPGALNRLRAQVIERLDAQLPGAEVEHHQVPFVDVGGDEQVQRLRLVDVGRAVGGELDQPALVDLEAGLEHVLFFLGQEVEVLDAAALLEDRIPDRRRCPSAFSSSSFSRYGFLIEKLPDRVLWV